MNNDIEQGRLVGQRAARIRAAILVALAVVLVGAGTASAGALITSKRVKDNSVGGADLRNGTLTRHDVRNGSLTGSDIVGALPGPDGEDGPQGSPGTDGLVGLNYARTPATDLAAGDLTTVVTHCVGTVVGGGVATSNPTKVEIVGSRPVNGNAWQVVLWNRNATTIQVEGRATCVS